LTGYFSSCEKKENNEDCLSIFDIVHDESASILGKWKLVKTMHPMSKGCLDYSKCNVVFEFRSDSVLTISGETIHIRPYFGFDTDEYEFFYSFVEPNQQNSFRTLKINTSYFWHRISVNELIIDDSPLDGGIYYLVKTIKK